VIKQVLVLSGPNLGRLGLREPEVYGSASFDDLAELCRSTGRKLGLSVDVRQTDDEREMISWVHEAADARLLAAEAEPARSAGPELEPEPGDTAP
jgi:3-dehydroquinate dehydratase-2